MSDRLVIGTAPSEPAPVLPGDTVVAIVPFKNKGGLPVTVAFRLAIRGSGLTTWNEGERELHKTVENVPPMTDADAPIYIEIERIVPDSWGAGEVYGRVDVSIGDGDFQVVESTYPSAAWVIQRPDVSWIEIVDPGIQYTVR